MPKKGNDMPLKMTNEVSWMDVFAIGSMVVGGTAFIFSYGTNIAENTLAVQSAQNDIARVERKVDQENGKIIDLIEKQTVEMRVIRQESEAGRIRIEDKLDKIIDRELTGSRH